jgi:hypothetical protein
VRFEVFVVVKSHTVVIWVVTWCNLVRGCQQFGKHTVSVFCPDINTTFFLSPNMFLFSDYHNEDLDMPESFVFPQWQNKKLKFFNKTVHHPLLAIMFMLL